jgi:cyclohexa-1,5-dienecarbonyl-CoA hydratase
MGVPPVVEGGLGRLVLNHPPLNILTREMLASLRGDLASLAAEPSIRVLLLAAEGEHFSAGADVGEHLPPAYQDLIPEFVDTVRALAEFPLPVIAVVRGRCLGGGFELVQAADMIVAAESASFGQPEILLGVLPPAACVLLPDLCPKGIAAQVIYTGESLSAEQALQAGLVVQVVPDAELEQAASSLASRVARHSAAALRIAKRMVRGGRSGDISRALAEAGRVYCDDLMCTGDAVEGLRAFMEKRRPAWSHS